VSPVPASPDGAKELNRSNSSVGLPSSSRRSEFSLSSFPEPPMTFTATANGIPSPTSAFKAHFDSDEQQPKSRTKTDSVAFPRIPALNDYPSIPQSMPNSPGRSSSDTGNMPSGISRMKVDSAGTQYDVTSFIGNLTTPGFKKGPAFDNMTVIDSDDGVSELNGSTPRTTMSTSPMTPNGALSSLSPTDVEKPMPALPPLATTSALGPQTDAPNQQVHKRNISANVLPSLSIDSSSDRQGNTSPHLLTGDNVARAAEVVGASGKRRAPPAGGLPARPRLAISGPKAPPLDGKGDQAPSAFEKPRRPPLILQQAAGKPPGIGGPF